MITTCAKCKTECDHTHWHDTAYGIEATHHAGSERWTCSNCGYSTFAIDHPKNPDLIFILDVN
jgi:hypothetical protein